MSNLEWNLVENPHIRKDVDTARNLPDAADAQHSLLGYAAINAVDEREEIARVAYELFMRRNENDQPGDADGDWFRAEEEVRRRRDFV